MSVPHQTTFNHIPVVQSLIQGQMINEARIVWAKMINPTLAGSYNIAVSSGMSQDLVLKTLPDSEEISDGGAIYVQDRGMTQVQGEIGKQLSFALTDTHENMGAYSSTLSTLLKTNTNIPVREDVTTIDYTTSTIDTNDTSLLELDRVDRNSIVLSTHILVHLNPSLDLWASAKGRKVIAGPSLGPRAWGLAVLTLLKPIVLSRKQFDALVGGAASTRRDMIKNLVTGKCATVSDNGEIDLHWEAVLVDSDGSDVVHSSWRTDRKAQKYLSKKFNMYRYFMEAMSRTADACFEAGQYEMELHIRGLSKEWYIKTMEERYVVPGRKIHSPAPQKTKVHLDFIPEDTQEEAQQAHTDVFTLPVDTETGTWDRGPLGGFTRSIADMQANREAQEAKYDRELEEYLGLLGLPSEYLRASEVVQVRT